MYLEAEYGIGKLNMIPGTDMFIITYLTQVTGVALVHYQL